LAKLVNQVRLYAVLGGDAESQDTASNTSRQVHRKWGCQ